MRLVEGLDLFVRAGRLVDSSLCITRENRALFCDLVSKLDGLPLAIELAAARLNIFSLEELSDRLAERFSVLRSRGRDGRALETALDWSWDLLGPEIKATLAQASVFRGGFTLEAAEAVIQVGSDTPSTAMFDMLGELMDYSLLRMDKRGPNNIRYILLESVRAYAGGKLDGEGESASTPRGHGSLATVRADHAAYFEQMGTEEALNRIKGPGGSALRRQLHLELDNFMAAVEHGSAQYAPRCADAAMMVIGDRGPVSLGIDVAKRALVIPSLGFVEQTRLELALFGFIRISGRAKDAYELLKQLRERLEDTGVFGGGPEDAGETGLEREADEDRAASLTRVDVLMSLGNAALDLRSYSEGEGPLQSGVCRVANTRGSPS